MTELTPEILQRYDPPFYLLNLEMAVERYQELTQNLPATVKYASKANFDPQLIQKLNHANCEFVCGSAFEAAVCHKYGVSASNLQVTAVAPSKKSIKLLTQLATLSSQFTTTVNSLSTVEQLLANGYQGEILLRFPPDSANQDVTKYKSGSQLKFGMREYEIDESVLLIEDSDATLTGVHAHMGGTFTDESIEKFRNHIQQTVQTADAIDAEFETINIGGGFGVKYHPEDEQVTISTLSNTLSEVTVEYEEYEFVVEPGRYIVAPTGTLVTEVRTTRETLDGRFVGVDAGMAEFPRTTMFDVYHHIERYDPNNSCERSTCTQTIAGPTCSGADVFASNRTLDRLEIGDTVLIQTVGAYGQVMANNFHAYPYPTVVSTTGTQSPPIRDVIDISDSFNIEL